MKPEAGTQSRILLRMNNGIPQTSTDTLAREEPLEIRLDLLVEGKRQQKSLSITMRTPGSDKDLALGFLFTEGLIQDISDIESVSYCGPVLNNGNTLKIVLKDFVRINLKRLERHFYTSSSCGVCGKSSIEALKTQTHFPSIKSSLKVREHVLLSLPNKLILAQNVFQKTGGLHASALFDAKGDLQTLAEDVGRHNALDKVIGRAFQEGSLPLYNTILLLSGRISFELVQKAAMAKISIIAALGAPSSLAVELAEAEDICLIGFLRESSYNIYSSFSRIQIDEAVKENSL